MTQRKCHTYYKLINVKCCRYTRLFSRWAYWLNWPFLLGAKKVTSCYCLKTKFLIREIDTIRFVWNNLSPEWEGPPANSPTQHFSSRGIEIESSISSLKLVLLSDILSLTIILTRLQTQSSYPFCL